MSDPDDRRTPDLPVPPEVDLLLLPRRAPPDKTQQTTAEEHAENRAAAARAIAVCDLSWQESRNPVFAWLAYREARAASIPVPEWVLEYLDQVGDGISKLWGNPPEKNKIASAVAEAMQLKSDGRGSLFARAHDLKWVSMGFWVDYYMRQGDKEYIALSNVARIHNVDPSTARRAWQRYQGFFRKS